jgi:hypothetical protein
MVESNLAYLSKHGLNEPRIIIPLAKAKTNNLRQNAELNRTAAITVIARAIYDDLVLLGPSARNTAARDICCCRRRIGHRLMTADMPYQRTGICSALNEEIYIHG